MIEENNKLIAKFMGCYLVNDDTLNFPNGYWMHQEESYPLRMNEYMFHESWDCLMPVVEKIKNNKDSRKIVIKNNIESVVPYIDSIRPINIGLLTVNLEATYKGVVEFIKWYNKN